MTKKILGSFLVLVLFLLVGPALVRAESQAANHIPVCPPGPKDEVARCHARVVVNGQGKPVTFVTPSGYGPADFHNAYNLPTSAVSGTPTIAVVDAYDDPTVEGDLLVYTRQFGIPDCTKANGCLTVVNQNGSTSPLPAVNSGWALEISLDVQTAHAICQNCKILLVEANSSSYADLMTAVDTAVSMGANVVSNSYGSREFSGENLFDFHFNHPGTAITFSAGDSGYGTSYPAASPYVTSVGGTSLYLNNGTYGNESVWSGTGSGCSAYEAKPSWQTDGGCSRRTMNDVAAVADPNTGAAVYDSTPYNGQAGWFQVGGTSLSSPLIAGVYALSGKYGGAANSLPYSFVNTANLHDVTVGNDGRCKRNSPYLCTARLGYDGPTGNGSPNGLTAF